MGGRGASSANPIKEGQRFMVYVKPPGTNKHIPYNVNTGEFYDRVVYAPMYGRGSYNSIKQWIDKNRKDNPDISVQIRKPGTSEVIYPPSRKKRKRK